MNETLLAETLGEDTTTQLWRDGAGRLRLYVMALPEGGGERTPPWESPRVYQEFTPDEAEARRFYAGGLAKRYVGEAQAFPPAQPDPTT